MELTFSFWLQIYITDRSQTVANNLWSKNGIPEMAASRLQRWAIILSAYTYEIQYKAVKEHGNANTLSRFPLNQDKHFKNEQNLEPVRS